MDAPLLEAVEPPFLHAAGRSQRLELASDQILIVGKRAQETQEFPIDRARSSLERAVGEASRSVDGNEAVEPVIERVEPPLDHQRSHSLQHARIGGHNLSPHHVEAERGGGDATGQSSSRPKTRASAWGTISTSQCHGNASAKNVARARWNYRAH